MEGTVVGYRQVTAFTGLLVKKPKKQQLGRKRFSQLSFFSYLCDLIYT